jgi:hypothetical protein
MGRLTGALVLVLVLVACSGSSTPTYNDAAVRAKAVDLVSTRQLLAPNGGPIATEDLAALFQIVKGACQSKNALIAMTRTMSTNPYLLAMTMKLVNAGCPDLVKETGIVVSG